jgi:hypothetical protein
MWAEKRQWSLIRKVSDDIFSVIVVVPWNKNRAVMLTAKISPEGIIEDKLCDCDRARVGLIGWKQEI